MASGEKAYKSSGSFITNCINTCISIAKVMVKSRFGATLPAAPASSCIVLGNGPSLNESLSKHGDFFKTHTLICVNSFSLTDQFVQLKPLYYVMLDPGFWLGDNDLVRNTISAIEKNTTWELHLLVPGAAKKSILFSQLVKNNPNIKIHYFNYTVFKGFDKIAYYFYKKNLAMPQSQNVLVASVFMAINLGFKEVYVVGADHTWHQNLFVDDDNKLCFKNVHFYEDKETVKYNYFYKGVHSSETFRMDEILTTWGKTFYGYIALNKYAVHNKVTIYNASEVSFIDAFKRIKL